MRRLESLPFDWFRLTSLKQVSLHTNPLLSPPMALAEKVRLDVYGLWSVVSDLWSVVYGLGIMIWCLGSMVLSLWSHAQIRRFNLILWV